MVKCHLRWTREREVYNKTQTYEQQRVVLGSWQDLEWFSKKKKKNWDYEQLGGFSNTFTQIKVYHWNVPTNTQSLFPTQETRGLWHLNLSEVSCYSTSLSLLLYFLIMNWMLCSPIISCLNHNFNVMISETD